MPRLERMAQLQPHAVMLDCAMQREAKLALPCEPRPIEAIAGAFEIGQDTQEILPHEMRQHKAVVQRGAPTHAAPSCGWRPNHAISARTSNCCARLMSASGAISKARNSTSP